LTKAFEFKSGHIVPVSFNYDYAEPDYSGTYVVLAKNSTNYYAMSGNPGTYSYMPKKDFTYDGTSKSVEVSDAELVWDFAKTANGYTLKNKSNNKYLSYTGSTNAAYVVDAVATGCYMSVSKSEGVFHINEPESGRALRYNSGSPRFAFYSNATGTADFLLVEAIYSATPVIQPITNPDKVDAAGATTSVNYTVLNPVSGESVSASSNQTWVNTFDYTTEGKISFKVDANTGEERTATVTVSYPGAESVQFTVTQNAPGGSTTYTWNLASGQLKTAGGTYTAGVITWTYPVLTYVGYDSTKGVQIGSGSNVQGECNINTEGFGTHTIKSIKVNASMGSKGNVTLTVRVGGAATSVNGQSLTTTATVYSATNINKSGKVEVILNATAKAAYLKSIEVVYE